MMSSRELQMTTQQWVELTRVGAAILLLISAFSTYAADADAGKEVFNQCAGCHAIGPDAAHRFGPQLNGVMSRGAGAASGYDYSAALSGKVAEGLSWDSTTLDAYLASPLTTMPGTKMAYPGLKSVDDRANVLAYLATINEDGSIAGQQKEAVAIEQASVATPASRALAADVAIPEHGVLHLGRIATAEEITAWDIDIRPDGQGLPIGSGSVEDGGVIYDAQCASCHGAFGEGEGRWPILAGGLDSLTEERPEKTIGSYWPYLSTVYDYIRRAMPFGNVRSLSDNDVYALTAYILYLNDLADDSFVLTEQNFQDTRLPNEDNFIKDTRHEEPWFESPSQPCMSNCIEGVATVVQRARILDVTPDKVDD